MCDEGGGAGEPQGPRPEDLAGRAPPPHRAPVALQDRHYLSLERSPLDDIRNTADIRYVMMNGRLYDGNTLNQIWPRERTMPTMWWQRN